MVITGYYYDIIAIHHLASHWAAMYNFPILAIMYCSPNDTYSCHLVHYTCIWLILYVLYVRSLNTATEVYIPCDSICKNGYCDYTCGTCVCHPFYTGEQCDRPLSKHQFI